MALGLLLIATGWKVFLLVRNVVPFNADEAIVGLMARHILQGERPVFFYGQAYMGSLDAYLVALGFLVFGQAVWVVRLVQMLLYVGILGTTFWLGKVAFGTWRSGLLAVLLLAIPPVNVTLYTTISLGGYGEALLIGNLLFTQALRMGRKPTMPGMVLWGGLAGLGLWADGLTLVYTVPGLALMAWKLKGESSRRQLNFAIFLVAGSLIGALPWWLFAAQTGVERLMMELLGSAVAVERLSWLERTGIHLVNYLLLGIPSALGLRPPWTVEWLGLPLLPLVLVAWGAVIWFWVKQVTKPSEYRSAYGLFAGQAILLSAGFLFTSFGVDPSGRYFLPLAVPLALIAGERAWSFNHFRNISFGRGGRVVFLGVLVTFQIWGNFQVAMSYPPGLTTQFDQQTVLDHRYLPELMTFLREHAETHGYANYWVAYPLAFQSGEEIIFVPRLPYHADLRYTVRDDRYKPYDAWVKASKKVAYISTRQTPLLDGALRKGFHELGVSYQDAFIGDYHVFYALSRAVQPAELGLGSTR
jgi:hypothetical protein